MDSMPISKFKATCLAVLEQVRRTGIPVLVTRRGVPVAQIIPPPAPRPGASAFGALGGRARETGDILEPVADPDDWEAART